MYIYEFNIRTFKNTCLFKQLLVKYTNLNTLCIHQFCVTEGRERRNLVLNSKNFFLFF